MNFPARWFLALVCVSLVGCAEVSERSGAAGSTSSGEPLNGKAAEASLDCAPTDPVGFFTAFVGEDVPGGPSTPSEALASYFTREGITVPPAKVAASTDAAAQLVYDDGSRRVFSAYVEKIGDSWYVTEYVDCSEWMRSLPRTGSEQE